MSTHDTKKQKRRGSNRRAVSRLNLPLYPREQVGKRLSRADLDEAVASRDAAKLSLEGQYAVDKKIWLDSPEQRKRADWRERDESLSYTLSVTREYARADREIGAKIRKAGRASWQESADRRRARDEAIRANYVRMRGENPQMRRTAVAQMVAESAGCSTRTVLRATRHT